MLRRRRELDFRDEQPLDLLQSLSHDGGDVFLGIFCGEIGMVKGCYGSSCEIGMGMVVCGGVFVGLLIGFGRGW